MNKLPNKYPRNICAYCGNSMHVTDDHIPPKNLFPKPRPNNLITVPACEKCHSTTSKDDEYFRIKMIIRDDAGNHPSARKNWDSLFRGLNRKEARGLCKSFLADFKNIQTRTTSNLYTGDRIGYGVNLKRIRRVIERIVRGLYFAEAGKPLGFNTGVKIISNDDLLDESKDVIDELHKTILEPLSTIGAKVIGDDVFIYRYHIKEENPAVSVWGISFYGYVPFLCLTAPAPSEKTQKDV